MPLPAYEQVLKASHTFNLLDARRAISVTERARFILRVRTLPRGVAQAYYASREALGFPMLRGAGASASVAATWKCAGRGSGARMLRRAARAHERRDLLIELGTEELPPKALRALELSFAEGLSTRLAQAGLVVAALQSFATPRRLALHIRRLAVRPDQLIKRRGPPLTASFDAAGAPTRAATAFAQSCGVALSAAWAANAMSKAASTCISKVSRAARRPRRCCRGCCSSPGCAAHP